MAITAADVKRLREETDAPMMECSAALKEANGDFEKAKEILREKGKAAATKRAERSTSEGVVAVSISDDLHTAAAAVLECETDFVARNEDFIATAQTIADALRKHVETKGVCDGGCDALAVEANGATVGTLVEQSVAKIRENIKLSKHHCLKTDGVYAAYVHHDRKKAAIVELKGTANNLVEVGHKLAIQIVALTPKYVRKSDISAEVIAHEIEIETQRAINEGKNEQIARNVAQGRVNKEFFQSQVLEEQGFYADHTKTVSQFVSEEAKAGGGSIEIVGMLHIAVGGS